MWRRSILFSSLSLLSSLILFACSQKGEAEGGVVSVNLLDKEEPSWTEFFKEIEVIQLENRDSAYLNISCLFSYVMAENKLYVFDRSNHAVVVFGLDGRWVETICKYGRGPGEYQMPTDIAYNEIFHSLDILDAAGTIFSYELEPPHSLLRKIKIPDLHSVHHFIPVDFGYYLFSSYEDPAVNYLDLGTGELIAVSGVPPVERNERASYHTTGSPFYVYDGKLFYVNGADGAIFQIEGNKAESVLTWDFGRYSFDPDRIDPNDVSIERFQNVSSLMAGPVARTWETERFLSANVFFMKQDINVLLDKENGKTTVFTKVKEGMDFYPGVYYDGALYALWPPEAASALFPPDYALPELDSNFMIIKYVL